MLLWRGDSKYVSSLENNKYCALSAYNASLSVLESTDCQIPTYLTLVLVPRQLHVPVAVFIALV